jgi:serine/threonine protein kinase
MGINTVRLYNLYKWQDTKDIVLFFPYIKKGEYTKVLVYNDEKNAVYIVTLPENEIKSMSYTHVNNTSLNRKIIQLFWEMKDEL